MVNHPRASAIVRETEINPRAKDVSITKEQAVRLAPGFEKELTKFLEQNQRLLDQLKQLNKQGNKILKSIAVDSDDTSKKLRRR